ncbi:hypothetical protein KSF_092980 [Reticulibacter mediterranei]|uniref:HTH marR-type domain-containing protein n=1 Tax=Reticulibacter mediterranei TaxID=2778369 RepID=A0A8J3N878_9CHLR|nr:MarR family transcriptional regulator [Reticulibacter mediterranei]GHO99250.1 hypothetical protein KSF_092980 [Reticulibacter mediterranei]
MEQDRENAQVQAVLDFMFFQNETLSRISHGFEDQTSCSPEEANILSLLSRRGPLRVKEIAQAMPGMDMSKLTRVLNSLEKHGYATRSLNPTDHRSFVITPTERGTQLLATFSNELETLARGMLHTLTPIERIILIELFTKIQTTWHQSQNP